MKEMEGRAPTSAPPSRTARAAEAASARIRSTLADLLEERSSSLIVGKLPTVSV